MLSLPGGISTVSIQSGELAQKRQGAVNQHSSLQARKVEVIFTPLQYCSGALKFKDGFWFCLINSRRPITHQRFTLAHELYHFDHHRDLADLFLDYSQVGWMEKEANRGAAELLMPAPIVFAVCEALKRRGRLFLEDLADFFGVSRQAMKIRLEELGIFGVRSCNQAFPFGSLGKCIRIFQGCLMKAFSLPSGKGAPSGLLDSGHSGFMSEPEFFYFRGPAPLLLRFFQKKLN